MESAQKADKRKADTPRERKSIDLESDEDMEPPSPIQIPSEAALTGDFGQQESHKVGPEAHNLNPLKALLEVAGVTGLRSFQDPDIFRKLTNRFVYTVCLSHVSHLTGYILETWFLSNG